MSDVRTMDCPDCNKTVRMDEIHCVQEPTHPKVKWSTSIPCPFCGEPAGRECTTASGNPKAYGPHSSRWDALKNARRSREMLFRLCHDDTRFGLKEGDELVCIDYPYDSKVTVLYRKSDGFNPECNQYTRSVEFLGWHS